MFRSTEDQYSGPEVVASDGMATPYFMLIQMNNASLLEAYATLGIEAAPAEIKETNFPAEFSAAKALSPIPFGEKDTAEHPGKTHSSGIDPIEEAENMTKGKAVDAIALGKKIAGRFAGNISGGGDFKTLIDAAMAAASLPEIDFDPAIFAHGSEIIAASSTDSSIVADPAGSAPFSGFRMDYRPETAPAAKRHTGAQYHSIDSTHHMLADPLAANMVAKAAIFSTRRHHAKGQNKK